MEAILLIISVIVIPILYWYVSWIIRRMGITPLPPGPVGLPIVGSLLSLNSTKPHESLMMMANKYAKKGIFSIQLGSLFTVVLVDPYLIKEALNKEVFTDRPPLYLTLGILKGKGIISSAGELWKDQRKLLVNWMRILGAARGAVTRPRLEARLKAASDRLEKKLETIDLSSVDTNKVLSGVIGNTIHELVFGVSFNDDDPLWHWLLNIQEEGVKCMGVAGIVNFLPFIRFLMPSINKAINVMLTGQLQVHRIIDVMADIRKKRIDKKNNIEHVYDPQDELMCKYYSLHEDKPHSCRFTPSQLIVCDDDCILDLYIEEMEKRRLSNNKEGFNRLIGEQLRYFSSDVFGASLDTSLKTLQWFLLYMAINKEEQDIVRKELYEVCGSNRPTLEHMSSCVRTRAAICETQRIRTTVPLGLPRGTTEDTILANYFIPKGTMIIPLQWYVHNDPTAWENPEQYKPSRFLAEDGNLLNPIHFMPFQIGKRMCPGDEFARLMIFTLASRILYKYNITLEESIPSMDGFPGLTLLPPKFKLHMELVNN